MIMRKQDGFLLMELLVTLALLVMLAPSLLGLISAGTATLAIAQEQTIAVCLAQEYLENLRGGDFCEVKSNGPQQVAGFAGYTREVEVVELTGIGEYLPMKSVQVIVRWQHGEREWQVRLVTWLTRR